MTNLQRANKITVTTDGMAWRATFARTHKEIGTFTSTEVQWAGKGFANKTAEREAFRTFACEIASEHGILWQPEDLRAEKNVRPNIYSTEAELIEDARRMIEDDMIAMVQKSPFGDMVTPKNVTADQVIAVTASAKGYDLSKMGIIDGRYLKNNAWAWANIPMTFTLLANGQEMYVTMTMQLVSGQLKKPKMTQTAMNEEIKKNLLEMGLITETVTEVPVAEAK